MEKDLLFNCQMLVKYKGSKELFQKSSWECPKAIPWKTAQSSFTQAKFKKAKPVF